MRLLRPKKAPASHICWAIGTGFVAVTGCGAETTEPDPQPSPSPVPSSVVVSSPIDTVLAVGRSTQLGAVASDAAGATLSGLMFTWRSSDESVAMVDQDGEVEGVGPGNATMSAETGGVTGTLRLQVVVADLAIISKLIGDPYAMALTAALTNTPREVIEEALNACAGALTTGHLLDLRACLETIGTATASDPTDQALLPILGLTASRSDQLLGF